MNETRATFRAEMGALAYRNESWIRAHRDALKAHEMEHHRIDLRWISCAQYL